MLKTLQLSANRILRRELGVTMMTTLMTMVVVLMVVMMTIRVNT